MTSSTTLLLATANEGKARELRALLPPSFEIVTAVALGFSIPEETGSSFEENARLKAVGLSLLVPHLVVSDDSGLEVDALGGRPGVLSARYAGEPSDDDANIRLLLHQLADIPPEDRAARFVCHLCLARSGAVLAVAEGVVSGTIGSTRRGGSGFGYDPVFVMADGRTMAELSPAEKSRISHRGDALRRILPRLRSLGELDVLRQLDLR